MDEIKNFKYRRSLTRLRLSNHSLRIETGRYVGEERQERVCQFCDKNVIENEKHLLISCPLYDKFRIPLYDTIRKYHRNFHDFSDDEKLDVIMKPDTLIVGAVASYIYRSVEFRRMRLLNEQVS